jgi:7-keto-8-aminopelargonate synthetase-like enzyme
MPTALERRILARLAALETRARRRQPPQVHDRRGMEYRLHDRHVLGFCSNDYLGLADDPRLRRIDAPLGAGSSRLVCGDLPEHRALEHGFAAQFCYDAAIAFPSGFAANIGTLPALLDGDDLACSDRGNHASLIDGLRLARAPRTILERGATPPSQHPSGGLLWWISESIDSMDGSRAPTRDLQRHLEAGHPAYVDEAHAAGLFARGLGLMGAAGLRPDVMLVTLGKAYAGAGAVLLCSTPIAEFLRGHARSFVYSTGISPALAAAMTIARQIVASPEGDDRREQLWRNVEHIHRALGGAPSSPIVPLIVGEDANAVRLSEELLREGIHVQAIRPPTVPEGTARLRLTLTASHTPPMIDRLLAALDRASKATGVQPQLLSEPATTPGPNS